MGKGNDITMTEIVRISSEGLMTRMTFRLRKKQHYS